MSFINHPDQLVPAPATVPQKRSIWQRMLDAVTDGQRAVSEQVMADLIVRNGGRMTDDVERQIALYL